MRVWLNAIVIGNWPYPCCHYTTHSMEQNTSWEGGRFSASQKIPRTLWNPMFHYCIHNCPTTVPTLSQLDQISAPAFLFLKIDPNIILQSTPGSSKWPLHYVFYLDPSSSYPRKTHMGNNWRMAVGMVWWVWWRGMRLTSLPLNWRWNRCAPTWWTT